MWVLLCETEDFYAGEYRPEFMVRGPFESQEAAMAFALNTEMLGATCRHYIRQVREARRSVPTPIEVEQALGVF